MTGNYNYVIMEEPMILGIPVIDKQHANLTRIINNLYLACNNNPEITNHRFIHAVSKTIDFIRHHFSTEEKLMTISDYPGYLEHRKEHGEFIWELLRHSRLFQDGQDFIPQNFMHFLSDWINAHIEGSDSEFADFFMNMQKHDKLRIVLAG